MSEDFDFLVIRNGMVDSEATAGRLAPALARGDFESYRRMIQELARYLSRFTAREAAERGDMIEAAIYYVLMQRKEIENLPGLAARDRWLIEAFGPAAQRLIAEREKEAAVYRAQAISEGRDPAEAVIEDLQDAVDELHDQVGYIQ